MFKWPGVWTGSLAWQADPIDRGRRASDPGSEIHLRRGFPASLSCV